MQALFNIAPFLLTILATLTLRRFKILHQSDKSAVISILFNLSIPALIISLLKNSNFQASDYKYIIAGVLVWIALAAIGFVSSRIIRFSPTESNTAFISFLGFQIGPLIYPLVLPNFASDAFAKMVLFDITLFLLMMTITYGLSIYYGAGKFDKKILAHKILYSPVVISIIIGVFLSSINFSMPLLDHTLDYLKASFGPLASILLGLSLTRISRSDFQRIIPISLMKVLGGMAIGFIITSILKIHGDYRSTIVLASAAPVPLTVLVFAEAEKLDSVLMSKIVALTIATALIILPASLLFI